jgi:formamidopyrimidine-DNA glycosylase
MPELPEVETLRVQLSGLIIGQTIEKIEILKPKCFIGDKKLVIGAKITGLRRFAKLTVIDLSNGLSLLIHLKMTGQLIYRGEKIQRELVITDPLLKTLPNKHTRVIIYFTSGDRLFFNDLRIFGWIKIIKNHESRITNQELENINEVIKKLGPDPIKDLTLEKFRSILNGSKKPVKIVLMDQEKISGIGNIYANDALFLAKINPKIPANRISDDRVEILFQKVIQELKDGIKYKGASEDNFRDAFGEMGSMQDHFLVYRKKGGKCPNNCGGKIERIVLGGRGTFYCPKCQMPIRRYSA